MFPFGFINEIPAAFRVRNETCERDRRRESEIRRSVNIFGETVDFSAYREIVEMSKLDSLMSTFSERI